jgi:hypothetical protein
MPDPTALPDHVRAIVDEIETEIGEDPRRAQTLIVGVGPHAGNGRFRFAPLPSPSPTSSAWPRKNGYWRSGSAWSETYRTSPRRQKICCVPLPWWKSTSRIATRPPVARTAASAAIAALL